ncbi:TRAP transporter large permease [Bacillus canaveralius]|nr:TRAP transporter large permease [Bacillus canaveralius]
MVVLISIFILLLINVPIGASFYLSTFLGAENANIPFETFASMPFQATHSFPLLAIPFFILAGQIMNHGKLVSRLVDLAEMLLYWLKGMLGYVTIIASAFLGAITGSSVATVAAVGSIIGNRMVENGYERGYVAALVAACGLLGVLIPPSISLIVYGAAVGASIADLFLATLFPGIIMVIAFLIVHFLMINRVMTSEEAMKPDKDSFTFVQQGKAMTLKKSVPVLVMPVIILGGIYGGIFTPTEAAAVAGVYGIIISLFGKTIKLKNIPGIFFSSAMTAASILTIIAFTSIFNKLLILEQIPQQLSEKIVEVTSSPVVFLLIVNLALFLVGMFMETNAAVLLMGPLLYPAVMKFGIDPIHFGIILVTNIELGLITPPLAANIYVSAKTNRSSLVEMFPYLVWFFLASVIVMMLITYIPGLSIWFKS